MIPLVHSGKTLVILVPPNLKNQTKLKILWHSTILVISMKAHEVKVRLGQRLIFDRCNLGDRGQKRLG